MKIVLALQISFFAELGLMAAAKGPSQHDEAVIPTTVRKLLNDKVQQRRT